ncbi:serine-rich adhesin for platelets-like [Daphnia pulex]|uniref:serine-rich adhesin for platelets-like n=1 Tax=Daphnia pulex TaxID=6669 RepID=UPI001EDEAC66|nr:serine-rich adhesin for platelets-like [Daphnia pulex]
MRRLIHTVLVGALVLVAAFGQAETRESLEQQQQQQSSTSNDQLQPDSNEKFKAANSAELHEKAIDTLILTTTEGLSISSETSVEKDSPKTSERVNVTANAEEPDDVSLEMGSLDGKIKVIVPVSKETVTVEPTAAQQAVNETASSDEVETTTTTQQVAIPVGNRNPIANRLLQNRLTRLRTTTVRNVVSTSKDSDEESDSTGRTTTRPAISAGGQAQQSDSGKRVFGRIRTTTAKSPTTTTAQDSKEDVVVATTTTVRNSPSGNRFSRVRATTAKTTTGRASESSEREDTISTARPTTVRSSLVNRFSRLRATTTTAATTILKDSGEQVEIVTPSPPTTTPRSLPRNRFNSFRGTTTSKPVARDSDEQTEKVNAIQTTTTTARNFVPGNRFARLRTTTIGSTSTSIKTTANSDEEIEVTTMTPRSLRPANRFSGRVRSTTTARTTTVTKDSDEVVDSGIVSTTTARSSTRGNRFRFSGLKPTTTPTTTTTRVSKSSDEQDDPVSGIQSTTVRNSNLRNKFIRTKPVRVTTTTMPKDSSAEDVDDKNGTLKLNSTLASNHTQVTTISALLISSDSGEDDKFVNGTLLITTTARNLDSDEKIDSVMNNNATQEVPTTTRSSIFLKYFNRYRTTKASQDHSGSSDEEGVADRAINETSPTPRPNVLNRLHTAAASIPPVTNLTAPASQSSETSNLGRKDRAIIYSSAKSDNQLMTSTVSTAEIPSTTMATTTTTTTTTTTKGFYAFGSSDEMDDTSEDDDDDASRAPYFDPYYGVPLRETPAGVPPSPLEENSLEVDDVSAELEFNITAKSDDHSSEVAMADMVPTKVSDVQHAVYLHPNMNDDDVSVEVIFRVPSNQPYQQDVRNQTGMAQHGVHFVPAESDEGNEGSVEEKEGSGDVLEENNTNGQNSTTTAIQQETNPVKDSDEGNEASMEKGTNGQVPEENNMSESNTTMKVDETPQNSDENDDNSSLEIDLSKLTDIQRILTDIKTEEVILSPRVSTVTVTETPQFFTDAKPIELILETENLTTTMPPVPVTEARSQNDSLSRQPVSSDEVTMKLKELLANPVVQLRLEAIDGRLKSTKSARVKRLIEKYLAALAKLSTSGASSSISFSIFLPLLITCFLFGFS